MSPPEGVKILGKIYETFNSALSCEICCPINRFLFHFCFLIDDTVEARHEEISFQGSLCYCEKDSCNNNFDKNSCDQIIIPIITIVGGIVVALFSSKAFY